MTYHSGGLWVTSFSFLCVVLFVLFFNAGVPVSANFFAEVLGLSLLFGCRFSGVFLVFAYYFLGLVYCILFFISLSSGVGAPIYPVGLITVAPLLSLSIVCFGLLR